MKKSIEDNKKELIDEITEIVEREDSPSEDSLGISFAKDGINKPAMKVESNQDSYNETHGKVYKMTHENTIPWRNYLIYGIILTMLSCCVCFAKYISFFSTNTSATVASFSYKINGQYGNQVIIQNSDWKDGVSNTVSFDASDDALFVFDVVNESDVAVKVTPAPSIIDKTSKKDILSDLNFAVSFYDEEPSNSSTPVGSISIQPHSTGSVWMNINAFDVEEANNDMTLEFTVEQLS